MSSSRADHYYILYNLFSIGQSCSSPVFRCQGKDNKYFKACEALKDEPGMLVTKDKAITPFGTIVF